MARSCKMTKMHFQLIADTIACLDFSYKADDDCKRYVAQEFAKALKRNQSSLRQLQVHRCKPPRTGADLDIVALRRRRLNRRLET